MDQNQGTASTALSPLVVITEQVSPQVSSLPMAQYNAPQFVSSPLINPFNSDISNNNNGFDATNVNQLVNYSLHTNTQFVSSPPINPSNSGSPSNISNNNNGFDIVYNAINLTQQGQSVPYDKYSLHTNTSMAQYNALSSPSVNSSNSGSLSADISNNNNGFGIIYNTTNVTQLGQSVPCDKYSLHTNTSMAQYNAPQFVSSSSINSSNNGSLSDISNNNNGFAQPGQSVPYDSYNLYTTTSVAQQYNAFTDSSQSVSPILSQTQTNDSRIFRLMIPGFHIIVIPNNNNNNM